MLKKGGNVHEDQHTILIIYLSILLRIINFRTEVVEKIKTQV